MAELEDVTLDGKQLNSLRVADLKSALEQRGLPKSGQKNALIKRLKGALMLESLQRTSTPHMGLQPNSQIGEEMSQNSFIKQYLAKQQELLRQRLEREAREAIEADDSPAGPDEDDHTEGSDITSCTSDQQHPLALAPAPPLVEEVMSAEATVLLPRSSAPTASQPHTATGSLDPGPHGAPSCAVASLSVRVLAGAAPALPGLQLSRPRDDSEEDEESEQEWSVRPRRGGRSQPTREKSRRKQQPPQLRQPTPPPSPPPEPSFLLPDTPKQSPPSLERPEGGAVPHSPGPLSTMESEGATTSPPMESAAPPPPPLQPPQEAAAVLSAPGGVATESRDQKEEQSPRAEKGRENLEEAPLSSLSPPPAPAPETPASGSPAAPPLAETRVDLNREPTLPEDQTTHVVMETEASTEPVLPPSPPPEEGDLSSSDSDSESSSSASSPSQEKSCPATAQRREDSGSGDSGALCKSGGSPNAPLAPPQKRKGEQPPEEEAGASHKKKPHPERGDIDEEVRRPQTREVKEAGSVLEEACTEGQGPAGGAVGRLEESTATKAFAARKISLTTTSKPTPGGGVVSVGALPLAPAVLPAVLPPGPPEEAESGGSAGRKRRWGSSTAATAKKPSISITTDSLKCLIPDIKPAAGPGSQEAVVELHPEESCLSGEEQGAELKICRTVTQVVSAENQENGQKKREEEEGYEEEGGDGQRVLKEERKADVALETQAAPTSKVDAKNVTPSDMLVWRSVSQQKSGVFVVIKDPAHTTRQPSPPHGKITNIVHMCNLVRPFTLGQLKELLNRTGTVVEEAFWIDKIKSHCYVTYSSSDEAMATRTALHGVKWPQSNPKFLSVDFCEQDELDFHRGVLVVPGAEEMGGVPAGVSQPTPSLLPEREKGRERERGEERGRERERGGGDQWAQREREMERRERARMEREWDRDKVCDLSTPWEEKEGRRSRSRDRERRRKEKKTDKKVEEPSAKLLDDLFCKTKASPCIYWLPLTEQQAQQREAERAERMKEREKRRKEQQQEGDRKREEKRRERVKGRDKEAGGVAVGGGAFRGMEGEREGEREREREGKREREGEGKREGEGERQRERGKEGEGERDGDKRRDSYRGRGAEPRPGGGQRSRSHSNPPPPRDRRR